jgi:hypothetical protein
MLSLLINSCMPVLSGSVLDTTSSQAVSEHELNSFNNRQHLSRDMRITTAQSIGLTGVSISCHVNFPGSQRNNQSGMIAHPGSPWGRRSELWSRGVRGKTSPALSPFILVTSITYAPDTVQQSELIEFLLLKQRGKEIGDKRA